MSSNKMRRSLSDGFVFTLTQASTSDSSAYQVLQKQALLRRLQSELQSLYPVCPKSPPRPDIAPLPFNQYFLLRSAVDAETLSLSHILQRTEANLRALKDKVAKLQEEKVWVGKRLAGIVEKVERAERSGLDLNLRLALRTETAFEEKEVRDMKLAQGVESVKKRKTPKAVRVKVLKPDGQQRKILIEKCAEQENTLAVLALEKAKVRDQLSHLIASTHTIVQGFGATSIEECSAMYQATLISVESLGKQAQLLLTKVAEAEGEKRRLQSTLKGVVLSQPDPRPRQRYEHRTSLNIVEPKWLSYTKSSLALMLQAVALCDDGGKLGPATVRTAVETLLLLEKKLVTALCISQQRAKIRAKISGSRKLRSITKAAILNKNIRTKQFAPYNPKQVNWEVNTMKEKMYLSHFVKDVALTDSALSTQVKISSSERLETLLTGAARLNYEVKEQILKQIREPERPRSEEASVDVTESQFAADVKTSQKNRSDAASMFARNKSAIFQNMFVLAAGRLRNRLRTVSSSEGVRSDLETITGIRGISRQLRTLDARLSATSKGRGLSLKAVYHEMTEIKKKAKAKSRSKPITRMHSPKEADADPQTTKSSQRLHSPTPVISLTRAPDFVGRLNSLVSARSEDY